MISNKWTMISSEGEQWGRYNLPRYTVTLFHMHQTHETSWCGNQSKSAIPSFSQSNPKVTIGYTLWLFNIAMV